MKALRTGVSNIRSAAEGGGNAPFTPFISWKDDDVKYLAFVTPAEEIPQVRFHNFVEIPTEDGTRYATFMCRKDPAWKEESGNTCKLCDYVGHKAQERFCAVAVELEPTSFKGKKPTEFAVKMRQSDDGREFPVWGIIIQSSKLFYNRLAAFNEKDPIDEVVYEVTRDGTGVDTEYHFYPFDARPDLSEFEDFIPGLVDILDEMGSESKYEEELVDVVPGSQKVWGKSNKPERQSRRSPLHDFDRIKQEVENRRASVESY